MQNNDHAVVTWDGRVVISTNPYPVEFCNLCADDIHPHDDVYEADGEIHHLECAQGGDA